MQLIAAQNNCKSYGCTLAVSTRSYRGKFLRFKQALESEHPQLEVQGELYPVPIAYQVIAACASQAQMIGVAALFFGETACSFFGVPVPDLVKKGQENRMLVFGALFTANGVAQGLVNTGAFEVSLYGKAVFSKIKEGRMPEVGELNDLLAHAAKVDL